MQVNFAHVGFGNYLAAHRVRDVLSPLAAPTKRLVQAAGEQSLLVDMTGGRRTRAVVSMDEGYLVLLAVSPEAFAERLHAALHGDNDAATIPAPGDEA